MAEDAAEAPRRRTDVPPFQVVLLDTDDWQRLRSLRLEALAESPTAFGSRLADEQRFGEAEWRERLRGSMRCVITVEGVDVAMAGAYLEGEMPVEAEMVSVWVRPEYRGMGYGGHLVETVLLWAETVGCESVAAWATETNETAIAIYEHHGFVRTGETQPLPSHPELMELAFRRTL